MQQVDKLKQRIRIWKDHMYTSACSDNFYYLSGRHRADEITLKRLEETLEHEVGSLNGTITTTN